jgi:hypothetical protein
MYIVCVSRRSVSGGFECVAMKSAVRENDRLGNSSAISSTNDDLINVRKC